MRKKLLRALGAEAVGTFIVVLVAMGVDVLYFTGRSDFDARWAARGLITAVVIYAFTAASGAHVNPVVSLAFTIRRDFPWPRCAAYIVAQFAGAFAAAGLMALWYGTRFGFGASHPGPHVAGIEAAGCETVLTFILVLVTLLTASNAGVVGRDAALAVGFAVATCGFLGGAISGASMNPARSLAPQLLAGEFSIIWIYVAGPLVGALAAIGVCHLVGGPSTKKERHAARGDAVP